METAITKRKLLQFVAQLDPVKLKIKGKLDSVLASLLVLDPTLDHRYVVKFLAKGLAPDQARMMVTQQAARVNPYTFHFHKHLGWLVWACTDKNCDDLLGVHKVSCVLSPSSIGEIFEGEGGYSDTDGEVRAYVKVGDQLLPSSQAMSSQTWWTVHEFRPQTNTILLIAYDNKKRCRKVHYKEVHPWVLNGCTIRRSVCLTCFKQFLFSCECGSGASRISHRNYCIFQFPCPDSTAAVAYIESILEGDTDNFSAAFALMNGDDSEYHSNDDHVYKMQREAGVRSWLLQKSSLAQVKSIMQTLSSDLSLDRSTWLNVGRILRSLSNNHPSELCGLWAAWSSSKADQCYAVWATLRPPTNCDEPAIVKARDYIQQNTSQFTADSTTATACTNLMLKSIIADANLILKQAVLEYWSDSEVSLENTPKKRTAFGGKPPSRKQITTPAAIYSYDAEALRHELSDVTGSKSRPPLHNIGQFEELQDARATIAPGSVISIKEGGSGSKAYSASWFLVQKVDLLFARLRVRPCLAPPFPWLEEQEGEEGEDTRAFWLPVSKVWFALVCFKVESFRGMDRYSIFTAPLPDPALAIRALESLASSSPNVSSEYEEQQGGLTLRVLHCDTTSITVGWEFLAVAGPIFSSYSSSRCETVAEKINVVSVRLSLPGCIGPWVEVYRGRGRGCRISSLQAAASYHVRLVSYSSLGDDELDECSTSFIMVNTTS